MQPAVVVEGQPVNHFVHCVSAGGKLLSIQPTHFQATPQALRGCVIPAVALATHGTSHLVARHRALEFMPAILAATVRMEDESRCRVTPEPCHLQSVRHQAALHVRLHAPAHYLTAEEVNDGGQVQPPLIGGDIRDVARPDLVVLLAFSDQISLPVGREASIASSQRFPRKVSGHGGIPPCPQ